MNNIYLSPPHMSGREMEYIKAAFDSNWIGPCGPFITALEEDLNQYIGAKNNFSVAMNTGTAAIHMALKMLGVKWGDEVFCSSLTFVASANPILYLGATPVFIDSEWETWNMSPKLLERAFQEKAKVNKLPKAVIVVDLFGMSADYEKLLEICHHFNVPLIEDAAEALGSRYCGRPCGSFGKFGVFSFNGNKIITTSSGGALITHSEVEAKEAVKLITQSREAVPFYQHNQIGFNYRMSNICAAIGKGQLEVIDNRIETKRKIFETYCEELSDIEEIQFLSEPEGHFSNRWLSTIFIDESSSVSPHRLIEDLKKEHIEARYIWKPLHKQPFFKNCEYFSDGSDISGKIFDRGVCLPSGTSMTIEQREFVVRTIKKSFFR